MLKRIISGIVVILLFAALLILKGTYLKVGIVLMGLICQYEMVNTIKKKDVRIMEIPIYLFALLMMPVLHLAGITGLFVLYAVTFMLFVIVRVFNERYTYESIIYSILAVFYPGLFLAFAYLITLIPDDQILIDAVLITVLAASGSDTFAFFTTVMFVGKSDIWFITIIMACISTWVCDSFAMFGGKWFGKHKLAPKISPNKTVEGAAGGLVGGAILSLLYVLFFAHRATGILWYMLLAVLLALLSQFGDLAASLAKRYFGIKDFGKIIPGHGGILDRVCSIIFVLPLTYGFIKLFYGI